jgi:phosphate transport system permease protein
MIRTVVLPFGRGGIIGGAMLGLGRALGETIAVAVIIGLIFHARLDWIDGGANGVAALIALKFGEANDKLRSALVAAGLALFTITLLVNLVASTVVARSRSGEGVDL